MPLSNLHPNPQLLPQQLEINVTFDPRPLHMANANRTIKEWCHNYLNCQQMKITRHVHPPTRHFNEAVVGCTHVNMDIVGFEYLPSTIRHCDTSLPSSTAAQIRLKPTQYIPSLRKKFATVFLYPGFLASDHCTSRPTVEPNMKVDYSRNFPKF